MVHPIRLNMSLILTNEGNYEGALKQTTRVLVKEEESIKIYQKALFRRA